MEQWQYLLILKAIAKAQIEAAGMTAENEARKASGLSPAYGDQAFFQVIQEMEAVFEANRG